MLVGEPVAHHGALLDTVHRGAVAPGSFLEDVLVNSDGEILLLFMSCLRNEALKILLVVARFLVK